MTRVLIIGHSYDIHVSAVAWLLRRRGHHVAVWQMDRFPVQQTVSLSIGPRGDEIAAGALIRRGEAFDTVWRRRVVKPRVDPGLHPSDRAVAERESRLFLDNAVNQLAAGARWVNPLESRQRAVSKAAQLRAARASGFDIPDTLLSNSPEDIAAFAERHGGEIIVKPFFPAAWQTATRTHHFYARRLDPALLRETFALRAAPAIYQALVPKAHELRVTVIGDRCFAARIEAPERDGGALDWKEDLHQREVTPCRLPDRVREACLGVMRRLGIVFGCMDVICRPDGGYTFLEVNEMGAFLWVEEYQPSMRLLGAFCDYLCGPAIRTDDAAGIFDFRDSSAFASFEAEEGDDVLAHQYALTMVE